MRWRAIPDLVVFDTSACEGAIAMPIEGLDLSDYCETAPGTGFEADGGCCVFDLLGTVNMATQKPSDAAVEFGDGCEYSHPTVCYRDLFTGHWRHEAPLTKDAAKSEVLAQKDVFSLGSTGTQPHLVMYQRRHTSRSVNLESLPPLAVSHTMNALRCHPGECLDTQDQGQSTGKMLVETLRKKVRVQQHASELVWHCYHRAMGKEPLESLVQGGNKHRAANGKAAGSVRRTKQGPQTLIRVRVRVRVRHQKQA